MRTWTLGSGYRGALEQIADELSWCIWELPGANSSVHPSGPQGTETRVGKSRGEVTGSERKVYGSQLFSASGAGLGGGLTTGESRVSKGQTRGANGIRKLNRNTRAPLPQPACPSRQRQSPTGGPGNEPMLQAGWQRAGLSEELASFLLLSTPWGRVPVLDSNIPSTRGNADGQRAREQITANHHGNANQNPNEVSPHICRKTTGNKGRWGCREEGTLVHSRWECKSVQPLWKTRASVLVQMVKKKKNPPAMWETWVQSLGWEDPLKEGMETTPVF